MSTGVVREALGESTERYDVLVAHLSVIRDVARLAHSASSFPDLCAALAARLVDGLGSERVTVFAARDGDDPTIAGTATQGERLDREQPTPPPPILRVLARDVVQAGRLLRWSDEGIGARRPVPTGLDGSVVGWPLLVGGERIGAVLCEEIVPTPWDLARQRALELVGEIIDQVVTLADVRLSMAGIQRGLEEELGTSRSILSDQEETLRAQAARISGLATSLVTSSQAKNSFLGLMSHELRTPLSVILGYGSILRDGLAGPVTAEQEEHLDRVLCNGRHLGQLIDDMLFFVDAETMRITPQWTPVDVAAIVREVTAATPEIAKPGAPRLEVTIAPDAAVLRTDAALLRRVLFHVVSNAFKFTEHGSVHVSATRAAAASATEIVVTDSGIGISAEQLRRIFELFRQGDDTHARKREGIGLGLNLVHACLVLIGGRCRVVARSEGGTRVELWVPDDGIVRDTTLLRGGSLTDAAALAATEATLVAVARDGAEVARVARVARDATAGAPAVQAYEAARRSGGV